MALLEAALRTRGGAIEAISILQAPQGQSRKVSVCSCLHSPPAHVEPARPFCSLRTLNGDPIGVDASQAESEMRTWRRWSENRAHRRRRTSSAGLIDVVDGHHRKAFGAGFQGFRSVASSTKVVCVGFPDRPFHVTSLGEGASILTVERDLLRVNPPTVAQIAETKSAAPSTAQPFAAPRSAPLRDSPGSGTG